MHADRKICALMAEHRLIYNQATELTNRIKNGRRHGGAEGAPGHAFLKPMPGFIVRAEKMALRSTRPRICRWLCRRVRPQHH